MMTEIVSNRRAYADYEILETIEAGIELRGFEVKAVKLGQINLTGSFAAIKGGEAWLLGAHIAPYQQKNIGVAYEPTRTRRLLLHKSEIRRLIGTGSQRGLTLLPLRVYLKNNRIKILLGVARRKRLHDKREHIKKRETKREIQREFKRG